MGRDSLFRRDHICEFGSIKETMPCDNNINRIGDGMQEGVKRGDRFKEHEKDDALWQRH